MKASLVEHDVVVLFIVQIGSLLLCCVFLMFLLCVGVGVVVVVVVVCRVS